MRFFHKMFEISVTLDPRIISVKFETALKMHIQVTRYLLQTVIFGKKLVYVTNSYLKHIISVKYGYIEY